MNKTIKTSVGMLKIENKIPRKINLIPAEELEKKLSYRKIYEKKHNGEFYNKPNFKRRG